MTINKQNEQNKKVSELQKGAGGYCHLLFNMLIKSPVIPAGNVIEMLYLMKTVSVCFVSRYSFIYHCDDGTHKGFSISLREWRDDAEGRGPKPKLFVRWQKLSNTTIAISHCPSLLDYTDHSRSGTTWRCLFEGWVWGWRVVFEKAGHGYISSEQSLEEGDHYHCLCNARHWTLTGQWHWIKNTCQLIVFICKKYFTIYRERKKYTKQNKKN